MKLQDNGDIILLALSIPDKYILNLKMKKKKNLHKSASYIGKMGEENLWRSLHQFSSICHLCILGFSSVLGFNVKFICVIYMLPVKIYHYIITHEEFSVREWGVKWKTFILLYFLPTIFQRSENVNFFFFAIFRFQNEWKIFSTSWNEFFRVDCAF